MATMTSVYVDTSGWAEPLVRNSPQHVAMEAYYRRLIANKRPLVTTNYIIAELVALLTARSRFTRPQVITIINRIKQIPHLSLIHVDATQDAAA